MRGFRHLVQDRRNRAAARELPASAVLAWRRTAPRCGAVFAGMRSAGRLTVMQDEALDVLAAYGIPMVPTPRRRERRRMPRTRRGCWAIPRW